MQVALKYELSLLCFQLKKFAAAEAHRKKLNLSRRCQHNQGGHIRRRCVVTDKLHCIHSVCVRPLLIG